VGLTGLEPVTLRLSSACSNQLSYRPEIADKGFNSLASLGGKGIRTPDIQLAKLALYQLSYAPGKNIFARNRLCRGQGTKTELWVIRPQVVALSRGHGILE
jgi:hypothetical protein